MYVTSRGGLSVNTKYLHCPVAEYSQWLLAQINKQHVYVTSHFKKYPFRNDKKLPISSPLDMNYTITGYFSRSRLSW